MIPSNHAGRSIPRIASQVTEVALACPTKCIPSISPKKKNPNSAAQIPPKNRTVPIAWNSLLFACLRPYAPKQMKGIAYARSPIMKPKNKGKKIAIAIEGSISWYLGTEIRDVAYW